MSQRGRNDTEIEAGDHSADVADNFDSAKMFLRIARSSRRRYDGRPKLRPVAIVERRGAVGIAGYVRARDKGMDDDRCPSKVSGEYGAPKFIPPRSSGSGPDVSLSVAAGAQWKCIRGGN